MKVKERALGILLMFLLISSKALISSDNLCSDDWPKFEDVVMPDLPIDKNQSIFNELVRDAILFCYFPLNCIIELFKNPSENTNNEDLFLTRYLENQE